MQNKPRKPEDARYLLDVVFGSIACSVVGHEHLVLPSVPATIAVIKDIARCSIAIAFQCPPFDRDGAVYAKHDASAISEVRLWTTLDNQKVIESHGAAGVLSGFGVVLPADLSDGVLERYVFRVPSRAESAERSTPSVEEDAPRLLHVIDKMKWMYFVPSDEMAVGVFATKSAQMKYELSMRCAKDGIARSRLVETPEGPVWDFSEEFELQAGLRRRTD